MTKIGIHGLRAARRWGLAGALTLAAAAAGAETADLDARCAAEAPQGRIEACQQAVARDPHDVRALRVLAWTYIRAGENEKALASLRAVVEARPDDPEVYFEYGTWLGSLRRYGEATEMLSDAIRLRPDYVDAYMIRSIALQKMGRFEDAHADVLRAAELGEVTAMFEAAEDYMDGVGTAVDEEKAFAWFRRAAERGHIGAMDRLVRVYLDGLLGQEPDAGEAERWAATARRAREAD